MAQEMRSMDFKWENTGELGKVIFSWVWTWRKEKRWKPKEVEKKKKGGDGLQGKEKMFAEEGYKVKENYVCLLLLRRILPVYRLWAE